MTIAQRSGWPARITFCVALFVCATAVGHAAQEKSLPVDAQVVVSLCVASGNVVVTGADRQEVRVSSADGAELELHAVPGGAPDKTVSQVEVRAKPSAAGAPLLAKHCVAASDLALTVPRKATVQLRSQSGDVTLHGIGAAKIQAMSGDVFLRDIDGAANVSTVSGDVSLENCRGAMQLRTISGNIDAENLQLSPGQKNIFSARSVSGDINLEQVSYQHLEIGTVSGNVFIDAVPPAGGVYDIKSTAGDITLAMPGGASFKVLAKVPRGEIVDDFNVKRSEPVAARTAVNYLSGTHGSGAATLTLYSDSGTVHLRRQ